MVELDPQRVSGRDHQRRRLEAGVARAADVVGVPVITILLAGGTAPDDVAAAGQLPHARLGLDVVGGGDVGLEVGVDDGRQDALADVVAAPGGGDPQLELDPPEVFEPDNSDREARAGPCQRQQLGHGHERAAGEHQRGVGVDDLDRGPGRQRRGAAVVELEVDAAGLADVDHAVAVARALALEDHRGE